MTAKNNTSLTSAFQKLAIEPDDPEPSLYDIHVLNELFCYLTFVLNLPLNTSETELDVLKLYRRTSDGFVTAPNNSPLQTWAYEQTLRAGTTAQVVSAEKQDIHAELKRLVVPTIEALLNDLKGELTHGERICRRNFEVLLRNLRR